jgi:hypothetical protein
MDYQCTENEKTGELKISVKGELLELSLCARIILDIIEGSESSYFKSKLHIDNLSTVVKPETVGIGNSKKELFSYSKNGLKYHFLPDGQSKNVVDAARNHYMVMLHRRFRDVDNYG